MYSPDYIWAKIIAHLESLLTPTIVGAWFDDAQIIEINDKQLVLYTPIDFHRDMILTRCEEYVQDALKQLFDIEHLELVVLTGDELDKYRRKKEHPRTIPNDPRYTFDNFVVGTSNRLAHAMALSVVNNPSQAHNPLFIYGPSGLGKTHLVYAIAMECARLHPDYNILYVRGEQFTNDLIQAIQEGKSMEFHEIYRNADMLLVDDVHFIAGKDSTQEEFFNTFNELYQDGKQIILTSDRPPREMAKLEERLLTRFEWGIITEITPPDYEMRMAIIQNKAKAIGLDIPYSVAVFISEHVTNNIRQLEGTVNKIKAYHDLGTEVDIGNVSRIIKDMYHDKASALPTPDLIIKETAQYYHLEPADLRGKQRTKSISEARHVAMYLVLKMTNMSLPDTGRQFDRDHTTVINARDKITAALLDHKSGMGETLRDIMENINNKL